MAVRQVIGRDAGALAEFLKHCAGYARDVGTLNPIDLAGGHKMTDDEIREALRLDFEQTADWRRSKAAEHPEDSRNLEAAALLDKLAASVETVAPDLLDAYGSLRDDYMDSEQHSEMFRQIGFDSWPETAEEFVKACIADRATGA